MVVCVRGRGCGHTHLVIISLQDESRNSNVTVGSQAVTFLSDTDGTKVRVQAVLNWSVYGTKQCVWVCVCACVWVCVRTCMCACLGIVIY